MTVGIDLLLSGVLLVSFMGATLHIIRFEDLDLKRHNRLLRLLLFPGFLFIALYLISLDLTNRFLNSTFENKELAALGSGTVMTAIIIMTADTPFGLLTTGIMGLVSFFTIANMGDEQVVTLE